MEAVRIALWKHEERQVLAHSLCNVSSTLKTSHISIDDRYAALVRL